MYLFKLSIFNCQNLTLYKQQFFSQDLSVSLNAAEKYFWLQVTFINSDSAIASTKHVLFHLKSADIISGQQIDTADVHTVYTRPLTIF